jgi:hypothetical protein
MVMVQLFADKALQFRDVFVITRSQELSETCGFVKGLDAEKFPCCVMTMDEYNQDSAHREALVEKIKKVS